MQINNILKMKLFENPYRNCKFVTRKSSVSPTIPSGLNSYITYSTPTALEQVVVNAFITNINSLMAISRKSN